MHDRFAITEHPLTGARPELSIGQLEDLRRGAADAGDHLAYRWLVIAAHPVLMGWVSINRERHAVAHAIDAWESRCRRTGGRPWLRSFDDPRGDRPCPGCATCSPAVAP